MKSRDGSVSGPHVGVLMAIYGGDSVDAFQAALQSLQKQTYPRDRIHIHLGIDGPIDDVMASFVQAHSEEFRSINRSVENQGLARTLNALIPLTQHCEYVARMDADDLSCPERLERQVDHLVRHPDVAILGTGITEFFGDELFPPRYYPSKDRVRKTIARSSPVAHPTVMFRSSALQRLGSYPDVLGNEDIAMWFKALSLGLVIDNLPETLLYFRVTKRMLERRGTRKAVGEFQAYIRGIRALKMHPLMQVFPALRLVYRCMPPSLSELVFRCVKLRNRIQL